MLLASSEYHGVSSPMNVAIENLGFPSVLSDKPFSLLGVAVGVIGAIKSLEVRGICSHVGAIVLPLAVSVARVLEVFDEQGLRRRQHRKADSSCGDHIRRAIFHGSLSKQLCASTRKLIPNNAKREAARLPTPPRLPQGVCH